MAAGCAREDCTVADTGICLLNNDPSDCPDRFSPGDGEAEATPQGRTAIQAELPSSRACTLADAKVLMTERYVHLVAILGEPDAGKTACLVSFYLSVARTRLEGFSFADSRTLMGFEEISQGARQWNDGRLPEQFTDHTVLQDERTAGFLHMRLNRSDCARPVDLLLSDLPGEWTTDLIGQNRTDRLQFVDRADAIWLVIDGTETVEPEKRQVCLQQSKLVIGRLRALVGPGRRLILVVTRRDVTEANGGVIDAICDEGRQCGFEVEAVAVASFAQDGAEVPAGTGISRLIELTIEFAPDPAAVWDEQDTGDASLELSHSGLHTVGGHDG